MYLLPNYAENKKVRDTEATHRKTQTPIVVTQLNKPWY